VTDEDKVRALDAGGYLETVLDGADSLDLVGRFEPHVVVLDCMMPGMSGLELASIQRASHGDDVILIAVSGMDEKAFSVSQTFAIVDHYLHKPVDFDKLTKVLPVVGLLRTLPQIAIR